MASEKRHITYEVFLVQVWYNILLVLCCNVFYHWPNKIQFDNWNYKIDYTIYIFGIKVSKLWLKYPIFLVGNTRYVFKISKGIWYTIPTEMSFGREILILPHIGFLGL